MNKVPRPPRTNHDFERAKAWTAKGHSNEKIMNHMQKKEWRSEVFEFQGITHCAHCNQIITVLTCEECGQSIEENHNE